MHTLRKKTHAFTIIELMVGVELPFKRSDSPIAV